MNKITDVTVRRFGQRSEGGAEIQIVEVETESGAKGTGFTSAGGQTGALYATIIRQNLRRVLLGEDALLTERLWRRMYEQAVPRRGARGIVLNCIGAIDIALWDLKARLLDAPVSHLFGDRRERIATYANCAFHLPPSELAEKAAGYVARGHKALKIRGTRGMVTTREATMRVQAVREAIGPEIKLMVDVNGSWDVDTAIQQLKTWEPYDVYWLEEPVPPEDIAGYVRVRQRAGRTYIVGGEQHTGLMEFRQLIDQGCVDFVQPNAAITGGITDWLRIYNYATAHSVPVSPWNLQAVHIHMAAGLSNVKWIEYFMADNPLLDFQHRLFSGPVMREEVTEEGVFLLPPEGPGLGLTLDDEVAAQSQISE